MSNGRGRAMTGFVRQKGAKHYAYWSTRDPATGKRRQHAKAFDTKTEARQHLNEVVAAVQSGTWRPEDHLTVGELLRTHWLPAKKSEDRLPSTISQYTNAIDAWIVPRLGAVKVAALTPQQVVAFSEQLRTEKTSRGRRGLSPRSRQVAVGVLKAACAYALENGLAPRNPIAGVKRPSGKSKAMSPWTAEQARRFLSATRGDRLAPAWALLLLGGLRRGEVAGCRWPNIDLEAKTLVVAETRIVVDGRAMPSQPKTDAGRRTVPLDERLVALLRAHKANQGRERLAAGAVYEDAGFVICDAIGKPYHPDTLSAWFESAAKAAGQPRIRLHDLRHTCATLLLADGVPPKVVSELLGHSNVNITLAVYGHVLPGMSEQAVSGLSAKLLD